MITEASVKSFYDPVTVLRYERSVSKEREIGRPDIFKDVKLLVDVTTEVKQAQIVKEKELPQWEDQQNMGSC